MRLRVMCFTVLTSVLAAMAWLSGKKEDLLLLLPPRRPLNED
ncbi:hypothetical protein AB0E08_07905 [Streptomyces sp. NPDC048281]